MQNASLYVRSNRWQHEHSIRLLRKAIPRMRWSCEEQAGKMAASLDVGCGTGDLTVEVLRPQLPSCVKSLVGVDFNSEMLSYASRNFQRERLRFVYTDITAPDLSVTPLGEVASEFGGFCKVFSFFCLHWVQDQRSALRNIHSLLRQGGEGLFCLVGHSPVFTAYENLMHQPRWSRYMTDAMTHISPYHNPLTTDPENALLLALKEANFKVLYCRHHLSNHLYATSGDFEDFLQSVNPFVGRMPEEDRTDFIKEILREIREITYSLFSDSIKNLNPNCIYTYILDAHVEK